MTSNEKLALVLAVMFCSILAGFGCGTAGEEEVVEKVLPTNLQRGPGFEHLIGRQFYVSPDGKTAASGSSDDPWDLQTSLRQPDLVGPGDTIWLLEGVYSGTFASELKGELEKPIVVRAYPGHRVTIDTQKSQSGAGIMVGGNDTWFWGIEVMSSNRTRTSSTAKSSADLGRVDGVTIAGERIRLINMVVHDTAIGIMVLASAVDPELYGNLIYFTGWKGPKNSHGPGVDSRIAAGVQRVADNIQFAGFGMGIRASASAQEVSGEYHLIGNVSINSGLLDKGPSGKSANYFVAGGDLAKSVRVEDNHSYHDSEHPTGRANLGWVYGETEGELTARNNYWVGGEAAVEIWKWNRVEFTNNFVYSKSKMMLVLSYEDGQDTSAYEWDNNRYYGSGRFRLQGSNTTWDDWQSETGLDASSRFDLGAPTENLTLVRQNEYDPNRAHIIVYNWNESQDVQVDLGQCLSVGTSFEILDAQNYFGEPVASGTYDGSPVAIAMDESTVATPVGDVPFEPEHSATAFGVFVLVAR